jgi:hypothetical protein
MPVPWCVSPASEARLGQTKRRAELPPGFTDTSHEQPVASDESAPETTRFEANEDAADSLRAVLGFGELETRPAESGGDRGTP